MVGFPLRQTTRAENRGNIRGSIINDFPLPAVPSCHCPLQERAWMGSGQEQICCCCCAALRAVMLPGGWRPSLQCGSQALPTWPCSRREAQLLPAGTLTAEQAAGSLPCSSPRGSLPWAPWEEGKGGTEVPRDSSGRLEGARDVPCGEHLQENPCWCLSLTWPGQESAGWQRGSATFPKHPALPGANRPHQLLQGFVCSWADDARQEWAVHRGVCPVKCRWGQLVTAPAVPEVWQVSGELAWRAGRDDLAAPQRCSLGDVYLHARCFVWRCITQSSSLTTSSDCSALLPSSPEVQITSVTGKHLALWKRLPMDTKSHIPQFILGSWFYRSRLYQRSICSGASGLLQLSIATENVNIIFKCIGKRNSLKCRYSSKSFFIEWCFSFKPVIV